MTTLGLVGGLGPESTIDYYRRLLEAWEREEPGTAPSIVIDRLLTAPVIADIPALDTTALHVAAIVKRLRSTAEP